jgi:hypothetical protein
MNKTLMLVICDFLLLSMLALARFDPPQPAPLPTLDATASTATAEAELIALLEESLQSELNSRENLNVNLVETRNTLQQQARLLNQREAALAVTQNALSLKATEAQDLARKKAELEALQAQMTAERATLAAAQAQLAERFENTRSQLENSNSERVMLASTLGQIKEERSVVKERLSQTEAALIQKEIDLAAREAALQAAEAEKTRLANESQQLQRQLEIAQAERQLLEQNLIQQQEDKIQLQQEKEQAFARADQLSQNVSQLGQGVSVLGQEVEILAQTSADIKEEIKASRPQTMSEIFTRFQQNRVELQFSSTEKGLLGGLTNREYLTKSIIIENSQGELFLVTHSSDTPFAFNKNPNNLLSVELQIQLNERRIPISQIGFLSSDPRLIFIPLPDKLVASSNLETFPLALEPERWEEAVIVKNDESNFGRTGFKRLTETKRFLKMDRPALGQLFADFATSSGDLAFTQNGRFIGALSNKDHAVVIESFLASAILQIGPNFDSLNNYKTINRLKDRVLQLPFDVQ